jgi:hypothetical protein
MLDYIINNPLCPLVVGLLGLYLGYLLARQNCEKSGDTKLHS